MYRESINWPDKSKCAVSITINLSAELFWLQLDQTCYDKPKTLSMGQYGMTNGLKRVLDTLDQKNIKATFFVPGKVVELYPLEMQDVLNRNHEIACSGYNYINLGIEDPICQENDISRGVNAIKKICNMTPLGFRAPVGELSKETLRIAHKYGMKYSSNLSDDDRPYYLDIGSEMKMLEIPIHWSLYDFPYFAFNYRPAFPIGQGRLANYSGVLSNWIDEFEGFYEYGLCYVLQLEPQTIGNPGRIRILEDTLTYITQKNNVWIATGQEIYEYMKNK